MPALKFNSELKSTPSIIYGAPGSYTRSHFIIFHSQKLYSWALSAGRLKHNIGAHISAAKWACALARSKLKRAVHKNEHLFRLLILVGYGYGTIQNLLINRAALIKQLLKQSGKADGSSTSVLTQN